MSPTILFCNLLVTLLFSYTLSTTVDEKPAASGRVTSDTSTIDGNKGNCSCGGFPSPTPEADALPLLSQSTGLTIKCDEEGEQTCKALCIALATATKAKGPEILCKRLKDTEELKLSAFYKTCDHPWFYANMTADEPLCCKDSKLIRPCPSMADAHTNTSETLANITV